MNPVMSVALDNGLEVTALHNHFFWDTPEGDVHAHRRHGRRERRSRPRSARCSRRSRRPAAARARCRRADIDPAKTHARPGEDRGGARLQGRAQGRRLQGRRSAARPRWTAHDDRQARWASTPGRRSPAATTRPSSTATSPCSRPSCRPCSRRCAAAGINIVAIHHHMTGEQPRDHVPALLGRRADARRWRRASRPRSTRRKTPAARAMSEHRAPRRRADATPATAPCTLRRVPARTSCAWARSASAGRSRSPATCSATWSRARLDLEEGLRRGPRAGAARARAARRAARDLLGWVRAGVLGATLVARRLHPAVVRDGAGALGALRALRRAALDAGRVLRHRRGGHRDHRAQRATSW